LPLSAGKPEDREAKRGLCMPITSDAHYDTYEIICGIFSLAVVVTAVMFGIFHG